MGKLQRKQSRGQENEGAFFASYQKEGKRARQEATVQYKKDAPARAWTDAMTEDLQYIEDALYQPPQHL